MEQVLPAPSCLEWMKAGYPQEGSRYVWVLSHDQWNLVLRHEAPSKDNRVAAITTKEANDWSFQNGFLDHDQCEELCSEGYPTGKTIWLWHKDKHQRDRWVLYKRNNNDMSQDADKHGLNRWITAITHDQAAVFRSRKAAMIEAQSEVSRPKDQIVWSLTFHAGPAEAIRTSACLFATSCRDSLINITEAHIGSFLKVTVYFWKDE